VADSEKPKKRSIKPSQTVRERVEKTKTEASKPKRSYPKIKKVTKPIAKPFGFAKKVFSHQPFRFIGKVLRFIGKIIFPTYFRNAWHELRLVTWPSWKQSRRLTYAVLIFSVVFGAIIASVDYGLGKLFRHILIGK
jgi:preprotein translocase subunit SecE